MRWQAGGVLEETSRRAGPLRPIELATASVLATMAVVLTVAGWFLPHLSIVAAFAVVPFGVLAHRHRVRALASAAVAATVLSFLVAGTGTVTNIVPCAAVGGLIGVAKRKDWGFAAVLAGMVVVGPVLAGVSIGLLWLFRSLRTLTIEQITNTWKGVRTFLNRLSVLHPVVHGIDRFVNDAARYWQVTVAAAVVLGCLWIAVLGWVFIGAVLERLAWIRGQDRLDAETLPQGRPSSEPDPDPVPVSLRNVGYRYPGTEVEALSSVTLEVRPAEMVAIVGDNGSGKSTLARLLAGRPPTTGTVERPGVCGLGRPGGTAMIFQNPDTQVLGVKVADDVVWGLATPRDVDVPALLRAVGLGGMADRETSGLSGGELQRLAVAAALARRPRLLISDESTSMIDQDGRRDLAGLLRSLPEREGVAVVHVTHRPEEASVSDRQVRLDRGRVIGEAPGMASSGSSGDTAHVAADRAAGNRAAGNTAAGDSAAGNTARRNSPTRSAASGTSATAKAIATARARAVAGRGARDRPARLELRDVSHTYALGTPWEKRALMGGIDLRVDPGDGVLVVGGNGSGKSTLAWIMAGLLRPTCGECFLGDSPVREQIGRVGLAFQHARLQLLRDVVSADLRNAGAADSRAVTAALAAVGLDAPEVAERRVDELSGGQQRRLALAGLLARQPAVMVLDEPLAGLDGPSSDSLLDLFAHLRGEGLTIVVISHDIAGMERVCDRVVRLDQGYITSDDTLRGAP